MKRFLPSALVAAAIAVTMVLPAYADAESEAYVARNASEALATLNDPKMTAAQRTEAFSRYMDKFTDINAVSNLVIGKYARRFTPDELARYRKVFRTYALAVYEAQLDAYRGEAVEVTGSIDRTPTDSIVSTVIRRKGGEKLEVKWRVFNRGGDYQVVDVALNLDGNVIWLGIEQRAQFLDILDKSNGSADKLIRTIEGMTADLTATKRK